MRTHDALRDRTRIRAGRHPLPTAAVIDSASVRAADSVPARSRGYDAGKRVNGRKRHLAVDTGGLLLAVVVTIAGLQDRDAACRLLAALRARCSRRPPGLDYYGERRFGQLNLSPVGVRRSVDHVVRSCMWWSRTRAAAVIAPIRHGQRLTRRSALKLVLSSELPRSAEALSAACSRLTQRSSAVSRRSAECLIDAVSAVRSPS
ncbi:hypothetical protein JOD57_002809 [Geodermatophilus bullaregiensis]|nr:hypothetical protein [Geodermatophilus bullaregiensis]